MKEGQSINKAGPLPMSLLRCRMTKASSPYQINQLTMLMRSSVVTPRRSCS